DSGPPPNTKSARSDPSVPWTTPAATRNGSTTPTPLVLLFPRPPPYRVEPHRPRPLPHPHLEPCHATPPPEHHPHHRGRYHLQTLLVVPAEADPALRPSRCPRHIPPA